MMKIVQNKFKNRILLTGSEGYIGKNFKEYFKDDYTFVCLDKKIGADIMEYDYGDNYIDGIIHLAAVSGIKNCQDDINQAAIDNIVCTTNLMKYAYTHLIPMVFASSGAAKKPESSFYAMTKNIGEITAKIYNDMGAEIYVLRFSNVYGGINYLTDKTSVVSQFINAFNNKESLRIHGDGTQVRDFVFIKGICNAINSCLLHDSILKNGPIDIGSGNGISINDLTEKFQDVSVIYDSNFTGGVSLAIADTKDAEKYLGFSASLYDRLDEYIKNECL